MYFRYRGATKGAEQFCYGVIDADNVKRRKFYEVQEFFSDISKYSNTLSSPIKNDVAIVYDYDSLASFRIQSQSLLLDCQKEMEKFYKAFYDRNVGVDIIPEDRDLSEYKIVILPQMIITKPEMEKKVKTFAENGGTVILTYRCAVKDSDNNVPFGKTIPVNYNDEVGIIVTETESLQDYDAFTIEGCGEFSDIRGTGGIFRDMIEVRDAEILFKYGDEFYRDFAAVTRKKNNRGCIYYIGCGMEYYLTEKIMETVMNENDIRTVPSADGTEVVERGSGNEKIQMLINHNAYETEVLGEILAPFECKIKNECISTGWSRLYWFTYCT